MEKNLEKTKIVSLLLVNRHEPTIDHEYIIQQGVKLFI